MEKDPFFGVGDHVSPCFHSLSWDHQPVGRAAELESALSSLISSPAAAADSVVVRELIGRLGTICNSAEISASADPGFAERAARLSCFGGRKESRAGSSESGGRKRKAAGSKPRGKEAAFPAPVKEEPSGKRSKSAEGEEGNAKASEPPKQDYIHVRARRGQATDSHSLAERVRREKISERMKFLQDLVPSCNRVTGKAVMLDEIINYVQSLQRQVEFLSMKLSTVDPRLHFNLDRLFAKDVNQSCGPIVPNSVSGTGFRYGDQLQVPPPENLIANGAHLRNLDGFMDASSRLGAFWEDDLQSVVQMGFAQNQEAVFSSQDFQGSLPTNHMKMEL